MNQTQLPIHVKRTAFGNDYRCLITPKAAPSMLIPLLHVTESYFKDKVTAEGGRLSVYRMGDERALEVLHKDLSWIERAEDDILRRIREVAAWMQEEAESRAV